MTESEYQDALIRVKKSLKNSHLPAVEEETEVHYMVLWRISKGQTKRPSKEFVKKLDEYFS